EVEAGIVELHDRRQVLGRPVVEVRGARREAAENGAFERGDVLPLAGNERAARIRRLDDLTRRSVFDVEHGQRVVTVLREIGDAEIEWERDGVVADVGSVMARPAVAYERIHADCVVDTTNPS